MVKRTRRTLRKRRYIAAFVITLLIFTLGFLAGIVLDGQRAEYLGEQAEQQQVEYSSVQLQYQLIQEIRNDGDCSAIRTTFNQNIKNLENTRLRLEGFQEDSATNEQEYEVLAREYTHAQIRYYLLAQSIQDLCGAEISNILYFYEPECSECDNQAFVLTYLKRVIGDKLLVFSFNRELAEQEPTIQLLMNRYQIQEFPSIVVNGELYEGYQPRQTVLENLCAWYQDDQEFCEDVTFSSTNPQ